MVIHRSSLWDLCEKYCSVVVCIDKNKVLVELGLVEQFDSVVVLKSSFTRSCGVEHCRICYRNDYRKFGNFSTNLGILFSSTMENNSIKYMHFDHSTPIVCDPVQS